MKFIWKNIKRNSVNLKMLSKWNEMYKYRKRKFVANVYFIINECVSRLYASMNITSNAIKLSFLVMVVHGKDATVSVLSLPPSSSSSVNAQIKHYTHKKKTSSILVVWFRVEIKVESQTKLFFQMGSQILFFLCHCIQYHILCSLIKVNLITMPMNNR